VSVLTLRANDQTPPLLRALVDRLDDVDQLLLVLEHPIELVVVTGPEVAHHVLVAVEEHDRHRIVQLVHDVEVGDLIDVAQVDHGEVCGEGGKTPSVTFRSMVLKDGKPRSLNLLLTRGAILYRTSSCRIQSGS